MKLLAGFTQCSKCKLFILESTGYCMYCAICPCSSCNNPIPLENVIHYHNNNPDRDGATNKLIKWTYKGKELA